MTIARAREILEQENSSLEDLLICLIALCREQGYLQATGNFYLRVSAAENVLEIDTYIQKIILRIKKCQSIIN